MNSLSFIGGISVKVYEIHQEIREKDIQELESPVNSPRHFEDNLPVLLGTLQMQWQRQAKTCLCRQMAQIVSNTTTPMLNIELKNVNTVLKLNMADTHVEDIKSNSVSSSFDNDDFSDDSDDNHYQKIARDIFGDSDSEDNEVFEGFSIQMPENVNWTL